MVRARLRGVNTVRKRLADGSVRRYHYHRATGLRLSGEPGSKIFLADYAAAEKTLLDRHAGTFNANPVSAAAGIAALDIVATTDGSVSALHFSAGDQVAEATELLRVETGASGDAA